jgi:hypothetical protein
MRNLLSFAPPLSLGGILACPRSTNAPAWLFGKQAGQVERPWSPAADHDFSDNAYHSERASPRVVIVNGAVSIVDQSKTMAAGGSLGPVSSPSPLSFMPPPRV